MINTNVMNKNITSMIVDKFIFNRIERKYAATRYIKISRNIPSFISVSHKAHGHTCQKIYDILPVFSPPG